MERLSRTSPTSLIIPSYRPNSGSRLVRKTLGRWEFNSLFSFFVHFIFSVFFLFLLVCYSVCCGSWFNICHAWSVTVPQVILTGDLTEGRVTRIFRSVDFGATFMTSELPFHPLMQITYNPRDSNILMVYSTNVRPVIAHKWRFSVWHWNYMRSYLISLSVWFMAVRGFWSQLEEDPWDCLSCEMVYRQTWN